MMSKVISDSNLKQCLEVIEQKLNWGSSQEWHSDVFAELSEKIHQDTGVLLSATTLKRVWGRIPYKSAPSITTLNTLAKFGGYGNWRAFKSLLNNKEEKRRFNFDFVKIKNQSVVFAWASGIALLFISLYSVFQSPDSVQLDTNLSDIKFSSRPVTIGVPNSVVFDFDLNDVDSDSIYIQQFWDPTKTIRVGRDQKQATGIYYFPGYFRAKLLVEGQLIKEHELFIKSDGWVGTIDYEPIPKFIRTNDFSKTGLGFSEEVVNEIKNNEAPVVSTFHFVSDGINVSGDNFKLETQIQNIYRDKWAVCQSTRIVLLGTTGAMIIPFSIPGCVSDIGVMLNTIFISGKEHDLSAFGHDFSSPRNVEIDVENKVISVAIDGTKIFTRSFPESIGNIVGLRYRFMGAGQINSLKLTSSNGLDIIDEQF